LTLLGDCYDVSNGILSIAHASDILVHEATLEDAFREKAITNGHSTPTMAANVANSISAKCLVLSHFSQRYKPVNYVDEKKNPLNFSKVHSANENDVLDNEMEELDNVQKLLDEAKAKFNGTVIAAHDLLAIKI
jgi:ribonuclease BN (tRNA processing enzyme)